MLRFGEFVLDVGERRLTRAGEPVELGGRYFDALVLLVREAGSLVTKERLLAEVWRGVPVTDEALTQAVRTLRRALGDEAARPRFIATVPKHGYRFVAAVSEAADEPRLAPQRSGSWSEGLIAGALGGAAAGAIGGLLYGFAAAGQPVEGGPGAASVLAVLVAVCGAIGLIAGLGVGGGIAIAAARWRAPAWRIAGGALGGLCIGAAVHLLGSDTFALLLGRTPGAIAGAGEGLLLGAATGLASAIGRDRLRRGVMVALGCGAVAGAAVPLLGGRLMAGSLASLLQRFPAAPLRLPLDGAWIASAMALLEGALFAACIVAALTLAHRTGRGAPRGLS